MESTPLHIIRSLKAGHKLSLNQLYDMYADVLFGCIIEIVKDESIAEEALQDTFVKIWQKIHQYDPEKSRFFSWIFKIARNTAIDKVRSRKRYDALDSSEETVGYVMENKYLNQLDTEKILGELNSDFEEVMRLSYIHGYSQIEISKLLDIPLGTVKSKIRLALAKLRKNYGVLMFLLIQIVIAYYG